MYLIESRQPFWKTKAATVFLLGGAMVEFWWPGVALCCVGSWLYCTHPTVGALLLWLAGTACLTLINGNWWACASFAVLAAMVSCVTIEIPRASRWFYLYYPPHLSIILLLGFRIQSP